MAYLTNIDQIRAVEWGKSYLWDIKFEDAPAPFDSWFPAIDVEEHLASLESQSFEAYMTQFKIPKSYAIPEIKITNSPEYHSEVKGSNIGFSLAAGPDLKISSFASVSGLLGYRFIQINNFEPKNAAFFPSRFTLNLNGIYFEGVIKIHL